MFQDHLSPISLHRLVALPHIAASAPGDNEGDLNHFMFIKIIHRDNEGVLNHLMLIKIIQHDNEGVLNHSMLIKIIQRDNEGVLIM